MSKAVVEKIAFVLMGLAALLATIPVVLIVVFIVQRGYPAISWEFLTAMPRSGMRAGGIYPAIIGTLYLVAGAMLVALPLGIGSALYLSEYAGVNPITGWIRLAIINLAGVPSVVYGLFGLGAFVLFLGMGSSIAAGSLTLALLILPLIITTSEEALNAVPQSYRQASLALGATKVQTIFRVVLPHALPGILTGTVLGMGRAAGETAPILLTVAAFYLPRLPRSLSDQVMALPYHLYVTATQIPNLDPSIPYGTALVLLVLVLGMSSLASFVRYRLRRRRS